MDEAQGPSGLRLRTHERGRGVHPDGGNWKDGRITLGGVSPVPYRAKVVEDALKGKDIKATIKQAAAQIRTVARPMSLNAYKVEVVQGLIERTVLEALGN